jgi:hypothetical protein
VPEEFSLDDYSPDELVSIFRSNSHSAEMEAEAIHGLLTSASLKSLIVRENVTELPTGWVEVKVLASEEGEAKQLMVAAQEAGSAPAAGGSPEE